MIPVELKSGLTTITELPARASGAENDSHLIYGARRTGRPKPRLWACRGRSGGKQCGKKFVAIRSAAFASCARRNCGRAFRTTGSILD